MSFDLIAFIIFILLVIVFLFIKRKNITIQKLFDNWMYFILYKTQLGLKWMDRLSEKHRNLVKLFGYCCIGFGFIGMIWFSLLILNHMIKFFLAPKVVDLGFQLVLPGISVPGVGVLSFFYFIISIFVLAIIHEFCHGVVMRAHDIKIKSSGFGFLTVGLPMMVLIIFIYLFIKKVINMNNLITFSLITIAFFILFN